MNRNTRNIAINTALAALLGTLALAGCNRNQPPATPPVTTDPTPAPAPPPVETPAPATVTVTSVDLGSSVGTDNRVATPATSFATTDTIYASVATSASDPVTPSTGKLTARWTYQDGQLVDELSQDYSFTGTGNTVFQVSNPDGWPAGKYKVEILMDGNVVQTREFEIK